MTHQSRALNLASRRPVIRLLVLLGLVGVVMGIIALIRRPAAYAIGLALLVVPPLWWGLMRWQDLWDYVADLSG